jgi:hypothetical protein
VALLFVTLGAWTAFGKAKYYYDIDRVDKGAVYTGICLVLIVTTLSVALW